MNNKNIYMTLISQLNKITMICMRQLLNYVYKGQSEQT